MSRNMLDMSHVWCSYKIYPRFTCALISVVSAYSIAIFCYYTLSLNHYISLLTTRSRRGCVERQSIISKRKF